LQEILEDIIRGEELVGIRKDIRAQRKRYFALTESADPDLLQTSGVKVRVKAELEEALRELGLYSQGRMAIEKTVKEIDDVDCASTPE
jgi:hypothetical protein